jgi:cobalt-zinc-cadmium efflux system membrane fusion protein
MDNRLLTEIKKYLRKHKKYKWHAVSACVVLVICGCFMIRSLYLSIRNSSKDATRLPANQVQVLHLSSEILKDYPISLAALAEIEPSEEVLLPGRVEKDPSQTAIITARALGRITEVLVKEADDVEAGQALAVIQSTEVANAQAAHLKTVLRFELEERQMERSKELFEHQIVSAKEHELTVMEYKSVKTELDASRTHLKYLNLSREDIRRLEKEHTYSGELSIRTPIGGIVIDRKAAIGQSVTADDTLFIVGKIDHVWIVLDVYEKDIPLINEGMGAEVLIPTSSGQPKAMSAKVARIAQEIDSTTRSAKVWLEVQNTEQQLKFGQAISARIQGVNQDRGNKKIQAIPIEALHKIEGRSIVFVKVGEFDFEPRKVEEGWTSDKWVEVKAGLKPGEQVVAKGSFILKSEFLRN